MKKCIKAITTTILSLAIMTGCARNPFATDDYHATLTVKSNVGVHGVFESHNGLGLTWTGQKQAITYPVRFFINKGESIEVEFKCEACGTTIKEKMTCPQSKLFECECPIEGDENNNAREYIVVKLYDIEKYLETQEEKNK